MAGHNRERLAPDEGGGDASHQPPQSFGPSRFKVDGSVVLWQIGCIRF